MDAKSLKMCPRDDLLDAMMAEAGREKDWPSRCRVACVDHQVGITIADCTGSVGITLRTPWQAIKIANAIKAAAHAVLDTLDTSDDSFDAA